MRWSNALDERLKALYERGFGDATVAETMTAETGVEITRDAVRWRAGKLGLEKDAENGAAALFTKPRQYEHIELSRLKDGSRILVAFSDMHIPFHDKASVRALLRFAQEFDPTHLIVPGDGLDFYTMSDFDKNPSRQFTFKQELETGHSVLRKIELATGKADRYWIDGNHEDRLRRWLWRHGAAIAGLPSLEPQKLLHLDDWKHLPYGSSVNVMGVVVEHGEVAGLNASSQMQKKRGTSGVCGHTHRLHDLHISNASGEHRYVENGCLCSLKPEFVSRPNWQHGFTYGIVVGGSVRLYPTLIQRDGFRAEGTWYRRQE